MSYPWPSDAKIIEIGARDGSLAAALAANGQRRFLAVAPSHEALQAIVANFPQLAGHVASCDNLGSRVVRNNNADVLVLRDWCGLALWNSRNVRHAGWIAVPMKPSMSSAVAIGLAIAGWLTRRLANPQMLRVEASGERLVVVRNRRRFQSTNARRFVPHQLGVAELLSALQERGVRHAVLRWFETLPAVKEGEDLDLLIGDESAVEVERLLSDGPGIQPLDLYTATGLPQTDFRGLPYYPPQLAEQLLDSAADHRGVCRAPNPLDHFRSLAYHAAYHKGAKSGLATSSSATPRLRNSDHDYATILQQLGSAVGYDGPVTLEDLDAHLAEVGWRPSHDMLARLSRFNPWLRSRLQLQSEAAGDNGLITFLLRRVGMERGGVDRAVSLIQSHGFRVLSSQVLSAEDAASAARSIRGGNWGQGPWPLSGGPPAAIVVAHDPHPIAPTRQQKKKQPFVVNARSLCKDRIRDAFNAGLAAQEHCNVIHSSDNGAEALEYVHALTPATCRTILEQVASVERPPSDSQRVADITKGGRRATVEVIRRHETLVVRKTFKAESLAHLEREVCFLAELGGSIACVPPLLARGEDWLEIPWYDDTLRYRRSSGKLLPLDAAKQAIAALREIHAAGYALVDASIDNLLIDRVEGLKLFDFEFSHRYQTRPERFEESFDVAGCPADYAGPLPIQGSNSYDRNWKPYIGLSLDSLLHDSEGVQRAKRAAYVAAHLHRFAPRRLRALVLGRRNLPRVESLAILRESKSAPAALDLGKRAA